MKKMFISFCMLAMIVLLSGCISIPFGDNVLEISSDGVEFLLAEDESVEDASEEDEQTDQSDEMANEPEDADDTEEAVGQEEQEETENKSDPAKSKESEELCDEQDYSDLSEIMKTELYIPDCATTPNVTDHSMHHTAVFTVENADWEEIYNDYKDFFGDKDFNLTHDFDRNSAELSTRLSDDGYAKIRIVQIGEMVEVRLQHYYK